MCFWAYSQTHGSKNLCYPRGNETYSLAMGHSIKRLRLPSPRDVNKTTTKAHPRRASGGSRVKGPRGLSGQSPKPCVVKSLGLRSEFSGLPLCEGKCSEEQRRNLNQGMKRTRPQQRKRRKQKDPTAGVDWWRCAVSFGLGAVSCRSLRNCPSTSATSLAASERTEASSHPPWTQTRRYQRRHCSRQGHLLRAPKCDKATAPHEPSNNQRNSHNTRSSQTKQANQTGRNRPVSAKTTDIRKRQATSQNHANHSTSNKQSSKHEDCPTS